MNPLVGIILGIFLLIIVGGIVITMNIEWSDDEPDGR